jgi:molybdopterin converting factor small subunit
MARVFIPAQLRDLTGGVSDVTVEATTVRQIVAALEARYPGLAGRLQQADKLAPGLAVAVDGDISSRGLWEQVGPASEVHFLPSVGGG